jgi:xylan 1,4-beta-xylosidase
MGPSLADTIRQCDELVKSRVLDVSRCFRRTRSGEAALLWRLRIDRRGWFAKPAFNAFKLLHQLGEQRLPVDSQSALATKRSDGTIELAVWNMYPPEEHGGPRKVTISLGPAGKHNARLSSWMLTTARYPMRISGWAATLSHFATTTSTLASSHPSSPETIQLHDGTLSLHLLPNALAVIEIKEHVSAPARPATVGQCLA